MNLESIIKNTKNPVCNVCREKLTIIETNAKKPCVIYSVNDYFYSNIEIHEQCEAIAKKRCEDSIEEEKLEITIKNKETDERIFLSQWDSSIQNANIEGLDPSIKKLLKAWQLTDDFGFLFHGPAGNGKSYTAAALAKRIHNALFVDFDFYNGGVVWDLDSHCSGPSKHILFKKSHELYKETQANEFVVPHVYKHKQYLFLDDLGTENLTEFKLETLYDLIDYRWVNKKPTFITTNLSLNQLRERFLERISSRILGMCVPLEIKGIDRRIEATKKRIELLQSRSND